ncbi:PH domain-containing protein [Saccharopolyspora sp. CA-218241]|uniref:PH domain-containing protein n=1 Tax=Saccharopolyspora sp. CA-218241 TaxID=3240027 RepID=UPI003D952B78
MNAAADDDWQRLDPKVVLAVLALVLAPMIPALAVMLIAGAEPTAVLTTLGIWLASAVAIGGLTASSWYFTRYRVTGERLEMRTGAVTRSHRSVPRDRIRSVDITAGPAHRVFGLAVLKVGAGGQGSGSTELKLDAVTRPVAEALRQELLYGSATAPQEQAEETPDGALAVMRPAWFGYSALTLSMMAVVWGAIASAVGSFSELLTAFGFWGVVYAAATSIPLWLIVLASSTVVLLTGMLGSLLLSLEAWWGFRLTRDRGDTLRVRRGLLTTRSISLEERRLRGVELVEPLLLRWVRGARVHAVTTGLSETKGDKQPDNNTLLPPAPRDVAQRVAGNVLRDEERPTALALRGHPSAALRRRLNWAVLWALPVVVAAVVLGVLGLVPVWLAVVAPVAVLAMGVGFAVDAYRGLGRALGERYLVSRSGSGLRRTVALQRSGIIGWRIKQSMFQRRSDLITVGATTAAGRGVYHVHDVLSADGLEFADEAAPGILAPFLERR